MLGRIDLHALRQAGAGRRMAGTSRAVPLLTRPLPTRRCRPAASGAAAATASPSPSPASPSPRRRGARVTTHATQPGGAAAAGVGIFPAGAKQARVELPALMVEADAASFSSDSAAFLAEINAAVTAGATAVVLAAGAGAGAAALYEAAVALRELLRGRAALLLLDRTDIATAVEADGVVLSAAGVPVVVARKMLSGGGALIGREATDVSAAVSAAADGANFVLLRGPAGALPAAGEVSDAKQRQRSGTAIPVIAAASGSPGDAASLAAVADGFGLPLKQLPAAAGAATTEAAVGKLLRTLTEARGGSSSSGAAVAAADAAGTTTVRVPEGLVRGDSSSSTGSGKGGSTLRRLLGGGREAEVETVVEAERTLLKQVLALLEEVVPQMDEVSLLRDALVALDGAFLVVVVGEFNSGKSTVINALLGEKFLADGILPTTNEISILKYLEPAADSDPSSAAQQELVQERDGLFVRRLPADLLKEMNIVDTPGTNVIVERQQRLTEEFVPRADMVLFVLSADRPLTDSELTFLRYIRQWRKKVVFVVNKVDMLSGEQEVQQLLEFVSDNARRLLSLDAPSVLPVSARAALKAKLECGSAVKRGAMDTVADDLLTDHPSWGASRFADFERFIYDFLVGGPAPDAPDGTPARIGEGLRLKLQTPLAVADALVSAAGRQLAAEIAAAEGELSALAAVRAQLARFGDEMSKDGAAQRAAARDLVNAVVKRAERFVDKTVALSNIGAASAYVLGGAGGPAALPVARGFDSEVVQGATDQMAALVTEHAEWLGSNCEAQGDYYASYLAARRRPARSGGNGSSGGSGEETAAAAARPAPPAASSSARPGTAADAGGALAAAKASAAAAGAGAGASLRAVADFDLGAAKVLLEEEIREAFLGTAGSAAGAQGLGLLAASWMHNTLEDILALSVAGLASYVSVLNLPLKRSEIKGKISKIAGSFADSVGSAMEAELRADVEATRARVLAAVEPLEAAWRAELEALRASEARREGLASQLAAMEKRAANLR